MDIKGPANQSWTAKIKYLNNFYIDENEPFLYQKLIKEKMQKTNKLKRQNTSMHFQSVRMNLLKEQD